MACVIIISHLMKYCRGESYYNTRFSRKLDCIPDNSQSAANQMIGNRPLQIAHLYWGADSPVSRIISLWTHSSITMLDLELQEVQFTTLGIC